MNQLLLKEAQLAPIQEEHVTLNSSGKLYMFVVRESGLPAGL